jgi:DNA-binding transcriptional LysR family regulator
MGTDDAAEAVAAGRPPGGGRREEEEQAGQAHPHVDEGDRPEHRGGDADEQERRAPGRGDDEQDAEPAGLRPAYEVREGATILTMVEAGLGSAWCRLWRSRAPPSGWRRSRSTRASRALGLAAAMPASPADRAFRALATGDA